jgi:hypothetical protein
MARAARLAPGSSTFEIAAQRTLAATQRLLVATAKARHADVMRADPRPGGFTRYVDGREGLPEEAARPDGVITYIYRRLDMVVEAALQTLFDLSPHASGAYRSGHTLFVAGQPVANLRDWRPGQEIAITNLRPYARKIEVGAMKMRVAGTDRVYAQAERILRRRFGKIADINFTYRGVVSGAQVNPLDAGPSVLAPLARGEKGRFAPGSRRRVSGGAHNRADVRFPTLLIEEAGAVLGRLSGRR